MTMEALVRQGIKIVDSDSKKKAKAALKASKAANDMSLKIGKMDLDSDGEWEEATEEERVAMATS